MTTNPSLPPAATLAPGAAAAATDEFRNPLSTSAWLLAGLGVALVAAVCAVGYLIAGFTLSPWIALAAGVALLTGALMILNRVR